MALMSKVKYLLIVILFSIYAPLRAQTTKLSLEFTGGIPIPLTYFTPSVSTYGGIGLKYNILKEIAIGAQISVGSFSGKNNSANSTEAPQQDNNNYSSFTNHFVRYTLEGQVNLERVFNLRRSMHRINPYLTFGGGLVTSSATADKVNGTDRSYSENNFYVYNIGLLMKYYLNPSLDFMLGANYNVSETYYLDAVPIDGKFDNYLMTYVGISYKIGARKDKQHAEWENVVLKDRIYIPDIEKRQGQPVDAAGNFFIFHKDSIAKLQSQTLALEGKTAELETKSIAQQKQIDSIQVEAKEMKTRMDTLESQMNQLKEQMNKQQAEPSKPDGKGVVAPIIVPSKGKTTKGNKPVSAGQKAVNNEAQPLTPASSENLNSIDDITFPVAHYNIIVGAYLSHKYAMIYRNKMRAQGYQSAVFRSSANSKMLRVCVFSSDDKKEALAMMRKVRKDVNPQAWMHIYNSK
jgi:hypothetical protein